MIKICMVCGKQFDGGPKAKLCSGACRIEHQREYQRNYKRANSELIKSYNQRVYAMKSNQTPKNTREDVINNIVKATPTKSKAIPDNYKASAWGKKYYRADRLDKIVVLSSALSKWNLEHMTYGYLSAIFESGRYFTMLYKVLELEAKEHETIS